MDHVDDDDDGDDCDHLKRAAPTPPPSSAAAHIRSQCRLPCSSSRRSAPRQTETASEGALHCGDVVAAASVGGISVSAFIQIIIIGRPNEGAMFMLHLHYVNEYRLVISGIVRREREPHS